MICLTLHFLMKLGTFSIFIVNTNAPRGYEFLIGYFCIKVTVTGSLNFLSFERVHKFSIQAKYDVFVAKDVSITPVYYFL